ncbi:MAG: OmpA family protein [Cyclobacteriaceae bacterium]
MNRFNFLLTISLVGTLLFGCANWSKTAKGGVIGAAAGGAVGAVVGKVAGNTALGAVIGASVGGTAGILIGRRMDKQAAEMRKDLENAKIERVEEGIIVTFDSGILFDFDKSDLKSAAKANISDLATTLQKYDDTNVMIVGHTDSKGADDYNQTLSEKRASAVSAYAQSQGITVTRIEKRGLGEKEPIASNDTDAGRSQNRRVEIAIYANEKMQKAAKRGDLEVN